MRARPQTNGETMTFLFRMAFWLGLVILLLPGPALRHVIPGPSTSGPQTLVGKPVSAETRQACARRFDACAESLQTFAQLWRDVFRFLTERGGQRGTRSASDAANPSHDTLTPTDLAAPWRGSPPRKEPLTRRSI